MSKIVVVVQGGVATVISDSPTEVVILDYDEMYEGGQGYHLVYPEVSKLDVEAIWTQALKEKEDVSRPAV